MTLRLCLQMFGPESEPYFSHNRQKGRQTGPEDHQTMTSPVDLAKLAKLQSQAAANRIGESNFSFSCNPADA
jgi:hypothetical protein